jgi:hypothetical protein
MTKKKFDEIDAAEIRAIAVELGVVKPTAIPMAKPRQPGRGLSRPVIQILPDGSEVRYRSIGEAARANNRQTSQVWSWLNKGQYREGKSQWRYA